MTTARWPACKAAPPSARAFAAYMRYAVRDRPVEEFTTEVKLPEWQLEPDDEYYFGDDSSYYYIDEQGNMVGPDGKPGDGGGYDSYGGGGAGGGGDYPQRSPEPPPVANDDFLEEATGRQPAGGAGEAVKR